MKLKTALVLAVLASLMAGCMVVPAHGRYSYGGGYHSHDHDDRGGGRGHRGGRY